MMSSKPAQGSERYLDFESARGITFRIQVVDDPTDVNAFTLHITPFPNVAPQEQSAPVLQPSDPFTSLTAREHDVAQLVVEGRTNNEIADQLCISLSTVKSHIRNIFAKMDVSTRTALVASYTAPRANSLLPVNH